MQTSETLAAAQLSLNKPLLQQGSRGEAVKELQTLLTKWGTYSSAIDGLFNLTVKNAVIAYQRRVFLVEDGIVGRLTWQALYIGAPVNMPVLQQGSKGRSVTLLQNVLASTKDYLAAIDGDFGPRTKAAVQAFQRRSNLVSDGVVADRTWHALSKIPR